MDVDVPRGSKRAPETDVINIDPRSTAAPRDAQCLEVLGLSKTTVSELFGRGYVASTAEWC
eukprot:10656558-Prorocentrum_lima.AAC.1